MRLSIQGKRFFEKQGHIHRVGSGREHAGFQSGRSVYVLIYNTPAGLVSNAFFGYKPAQTVSLLQVGLVQYHHHPPVSSTPPLAPGASSRIRFRQHPGGALLSQEFERMYSSHCSEIRALTSQCYSFTDTTNIVPARVHSSRRQPWRGRASRSGEGRPTPTGSRPVHLKPHSNLSLLQLLRCKWSQRLPARYTSVILLWHPRIVECIRIRGRQCVVS